MRARRPLHAHFSHVSPFERLAGLLVLFAGFGILSGLHEAGELPWGLAVCAVGFIALTRRSGVSLDFEARQVVRWNGIVVPFSREAAPFSAFDRLALEGVDRRRRRSGARFAFPLELRGKAPAILITELRDYRKARLKARELARAIGVSIEDHGVLRDVTHLDEPLRDRLLRTDEVPGQVVLDHADPFRTASRYHRAPEVPKGSSIKAEDGLSDTTIEVPGERRWQPLAVSALFVAAPLWLAVSELVSYRSDALELPGPFWVWLGFLMIGARLMLPRLRAFTSKWRVTVGGGELVVARRSLLGTRRVVLPVAELDDVHVSFGEEPRYHNLISRMEYRGQSRFVVARSDKRAVAFGVGLSDAELAFLVERVQHAVATRPLRR